MISGDAQLSVTISDDGLVALGTFSPPVADGKPQTLDDVLFQLNQNGVIYGIDEAQIQKSLDYCNEKHEVLGGVPLAIGKPAVAELPEAWIFPPRIRRLNSIFHSDQGYADDDKAKAASFQLKKESQQVDFRETHSWLIIKKDQVIAKKRETKAGEIGTNIRGEAIPFQIAEIKKLEPDKNTTIVDDKVLATADGKLTWNDKSFWIDTQIEIAGDIDYKTGNIRFPGDLLLKGAIKDRFKIWVGGSIASSTTIDAYEIFAKGSLSTPEGIIGRQKALIRVKGEIESKFIENCNIDCLSYIRVKNAILKSKIYTTGSVYLGDKGKVVGGELMAGNKLDAAILGNVAEMSTPIQLGINYVVQRKVRFAREKLEEFGIRLKRDEQRNQSLNSPKLTRRIEYLRVQIESLNKEVDSLLEKIFFDEKPILIVRGIIYPNVHIRLRDAELTIKSEAKAQRFELSEDDSMVIQGSLKDMGKKEDAEASPKETYDESRSEVEKDSESDSSSDAYLDDQSS